MPELVKSVNPFAANAEADLSDLAAYVSARKVQAERVARAKLGKVLEAYKEGGDIDRALLDAENAAVAFGAIQTIERIVSGATSNGAGENGG